MAIPNRTTITCPNCGTSEAKTIGDSSVGPRGRVSDTPIYSLFGGDLWEVTRDGDEPRVSCKTCGEANFATLTELVNAGKRRK